MKNHFFLCTIWLIMNVSAEAQINVKVSLPVWGPVVTTEEYYYLPEIDSYYDINHSQFIYLNKGLWVRSRNLPGRYKNYNLNTGRVVVIKDYRGRSPYAHYKNHKMKYYKSNNKWKSTGNGNGKVKGSNGKGKNGNK